MEVPWIALLDCVEDPDRCAEAVGTVLLYDAETDSSSICAADADHLRAAEFAHSRRPAVSYDL